MGFATARRSNRGSGKKFRVRLTTKDVMSLNNVGDLADIIARKMT